MSASGWVQHPTSPDRLAILEAGLGRNSRLAEQQRVSRVTLRMVSVLGLIASVISLFDLSLLLRAAH